MREIVKVKIIGSKVLWDEDGRNGFVNIEQNPVQESTSDCSDSEKPPPSLDMSHGFIKSIIRNQIDRDEYDKEVKDSERNRKLDRKRKPRLRVQEIYIPPHKRAEMKCHEEQVEEQLPQKTTTQPTVPTLSQKIAQRYLKSKDHEPQRPKANSTPAVQSTLPKPSPFTLSITHKKEKYEIDVLKGEAASRLTKIICSQFQLPDSIASELRKRLESEMERRFL